MIDLLVGLVTLPVKVIGKLIKHPKVFIGLGVLVFVVIGFRNCGSASPTIAKTQPYQVSAPTKVQAPYVCQTASRLYYVTKYTVANNIYTLTEYYAYDKEWALYKTPLTLAPRYYGKVILNARMD